MHRLGNRNFRSVGGGDAPLAVQVNHLETNLKEATYRVQQAEERYRHTGSLVTRLWSGDHDAAVQLSKIFNLGNPTKWPDLKLSYSGEYDGFHARRSQNSSRNHSTCQSNFSTAATAHALSRESVCELSLSPPSTCPKYTSALEPPIVPNILSPSRKLCSTSSAGTNRTFRDLTSQTSNSHDSSSSSYGGRFSKGKSFRTPRPETTKSTPRPMAVSSYRADVPRVAVPSRVLRNRGLYHSIPVVNIVPRTSIPAAHVANVIPSGNHCSGNSRSNSSPSKLHGQYENARSSAFYASDFLPRSLDSPRRNQHQSSPANHKSIPKPTDSYYTKDSSFYTDVEFEKTLARIYGKTNGMADNRIRHDI